MKIFLAILAILIIRIASEPKCIYEPYDLTCTSDIESILIRGILIENNRTETVKLNNCKITEIAPDAFKGLPNMRVLNLSSNNIDHLSIGVFNNNIHLTTLDLKHNGLKQLENTLFDKTENLENLDLSNNRILELLEGTFERTKRLISLDLSNNLIRGRYLEANIFPKTLNHLYLSKNDMQGSRPDPFRFFNNLETIALSESKLKEFPEFASNENFRTVKEMDLSWNNIQSIDAKSLKNLHSLQILNLTHNQISHLQEDLLKPMVNLHSLFLSYNLISNIPVGVFLNTKLKYIDVSYNLITEIPVNAFRNPTIEHLDVAKNLFSYLQNNFILELRNSGVNLRQFYFNQNPWQCACLLELVLELKRYHVLYNKEQYDGGVPVCVSVDNNCHRQPNENQKYVQLYGELITE